MCAMITISSSLAPGNVPQTLAARRPDTIWLSTDSVTVTRSPRPSRSRSRMPSS